MKWYIDQFHIDHTDRWDDLRRQPLAESHRLQEYYAARPSRWRFDTPAPAEPAPSPTGDDGPDNPDRPTPDESRATPVAPASRYPTDEGHAFLGMAIEALAAKGTARATRDALADVADYASERGRHHSRPPVAGELPREYLRRQRTARRRTNLVLAAKT